MTDENPTPPPVREAVVRKRKGFQTIWLIPVVTAAIAGWLWYRAAQQQGPVIEVTFATADGLEAGKTRLKYKDMEVGVVSDLRFDEAIENVVATAEMNAGTEPFLTDRSRFWVVLPRIGAEGISGLGTIVSGSYIDIEASTDGEPAREFRGLDAPPRRPVDAPGLRVRLRSDMLGSIGPGSPVSHLGIPMGDVEGYEYLRDDATIEFEVYVEPEHADLVRANTRFWNASGFDVSLGTGGFDVHVESFQALLSGGVAFGIPEDETPGPAAVAGDVFLLHGSRHDAFEVVSDPRRSVAFFHEPLDGLTVGAPVTFQGIEIGHVLELGVSVDHDTLEFAMPVVFETYQGRLDVRGGEPDEPHAQRIAQLVAEGLRVQLGPANLVTGARGILVDFLPDREGRLFGGHALPEVPTIPSTGEALAGVVEQLPEIVSDLADTVNALARLTNAEETDRALTSLASATESLDVLLRDVGGEAGPLLESLRELMTRLDGVVSAIEGDAPAIMADLADTAEAARGLLREGESGVAGLAGDMPALQYELLQALREIRSGMRSIASLAETLDRHPEALLSGKPDSGGQ